MGCLPFLFTDVQGNFVLADVLLVLSMGEASFCLYDQLFFSALACLWRCLNSEVSFELVFTSYWFSH